MRRSDRIGWAGVAALGLLGGCHDLASRPKEHASSALLDSGPQPKLSKQQAADVQVALGRSHEEQGRVRRGQVGLPRGPQEGPEAGRRRGPAGDPRRPQGRRGGGRQALRPGPEAQAERPRDPLRPGLQPLPPPTLGRRRGQPEEGPGRRPARTPGATPTSALVLARQGRQPGRPGGVRQGRLRPGRRRGRTSAWSWRWRDVSRSRGGNTPWPWRPSPPRAGRRRASRPPTVALNGRLDPRAIAANGQAAPPIDPALVRTSAEPSGR